MWTNFYGSDPSYHFPTRGCLGAVKIASTGNTDAEKAVSGERSPTIQALAKLCRITSCFPGAFAPVCVKCPESDKHSGNDELADDKLQKWGNLGKAATFLDGGVLNNKPFSHTLNLTT